MWHSELNPTSTPRGKSCSVRGEHIQDVPRLGRTGNLLNLVQLIRGKFARERAASGCELASDRTPTPRGRSCPLHGLAALALAVIFLLTGERTATAHGGLSAEADTCVLRFPGTAYKMHFAGYQPNSQQKEFCEDIPEGGRTIVALDYFSPELRRMEVELRIIRNTGDVSAETNNVDGITELYLPPQKRPTGTFNFEHNFEQGKYVGLLRLRDDSGEHVSRFPFAVGVASTQHAVHYALMFLLLLAAGGAVIWVSRKNQTRVM